MTSLRIVFMGTPDFSVPCLKSLAEAGHKVVAVYSQPPRPAGRGHKEKLSPIHAYAVEQGWPVYTPKTFRDEDVQATFAAHNADVAVVVAYGLILPTEALYAPEMGCINIHASLLPRWRGAAPIQRAIEAGDAESGVCIMNMVEELDAGDVILEGRVPITENTTATVLHDQLSELGGDLIVKALAGLADRSLTATPQPLKGVTYAKKLSRDESELDWDASAVDLERKVRALTPWPGVHFSYQGNRFKVQKVSVEKTKSAGNPGELLDDELLVCCGDDALRIEKLQRPGKGVMDAKALLNGFPLKAGTNLREVKA